MNKRVLYVIIALLVIIILALSYENKTVVMFRPNKKDVIVKDFGVIHKNKIHKFLFKYENIHYDTLKVYGVIDGCDCTKSNVIAKNYLKKQVIEIYTEYDPNKYNDNGFKEKEIYLVTNKKVSTLDTIFPLVLKGFVEN